MPEIQFLLEAKEKDLLRTGGEDLAEAVLSMRQGEVERKAGFDGQFGEIKVKIQPKKEEQVTLF